MNDPFGDEARRSSDPQTAGHQIGQDLSTLSLHELEERIALLRSEITRLDEARQRKAASRSAADSVFKF